MTDLPDPNHGGPHVVLLGAGASLAAFPNGDRHGRTLPLMDNLAAVARLEPILRKHGIEWDGNDIEAMFSHLTADTANSACVAELEQAVFDYFASLEIPAEPTLYDHLVLSLRKKDVIVTFNWDPLLWQALCRNAEFVDMPLPLYLHGNVAVGYCGHHRPVTIGARGRACGRCGKLLEPSRLLYPVTQKNYNADPFIAGAWKEVQRHLKHAMLFTIFGYSAPETDVEAVDLLKGGWGDKARRVIEQIEIIDIKDAEELGRTWNPFICRDHYCVYHGFYDSMMALHPRRSCEAMWDAAMLNAPHEKRPLPCDADWPDLLEWYHPLIDQEREYERTVAEGGQ